MGMEVLKKPVGYRDEELVAPRGVEKEILKIGRRLSQSYREGTLYVPMGSFMALLNLTAGHNYKDVDVEEALIRMTAWQHGKRGEVFGSRYLKSRMSSPPPKKREMVYAMTRDGALWLHRRRMIYWFWNFQCRVRHFFRGRLRMRL